MAESAEHAFISETFNTTLEAFSKTRLYTYRESARKAFDFSCTLTRDLSRPLVGQTLWKHEEGIDKDLRHLILDEESSIKIYLCRDLLKSRARVEDVLADFRRSSLGQNLFKLRLFWLPPDFEAGNEAHEVIVRNQIRDAVYNDVLLGVVFGHITAADVLTFLRAPGYPGVNFAILRALSEEGFLNYAWLSKKIGVSSSKLRETMPYLLGSGFANSKRMESMPYLTRKGRLFLEIIRTFSRESPGPFGAETLYILSKLDIRPRSLKLYSNDTDYETDSFASLLYHLQGAKREYGVDVNSLSFEFEERTIRGPVQPTIQPDGPASGWDAGEPRR